jgi:ribosomal protein S18 acetylase RimI-like enzyme
MTSARPLELFQPASVEEARALLAASPPLVQSPTELRIRGDERLDDTFAHGWRRPEWVWAVRYADEPTPLGVVAASGTPFPDETAWVLNFFGLPADPMAADALVVHATEAVLAAGADEAGFFAPTDTTADDPSLAAIVGPLRAAGWRLLVERRHYEFLARPGLAADVPVSLTFEQLTDPADPRLADCHREVMRDTLDAHDAATVARVGFDEGCREALAFLLDSDPVDCIHLALDPDGEPVGFVSGLVRPNGRAFILFVGVARDHRGHGYGRQLLAWQTRQLLEGGARVLIADTDNQNVPMARAFADVGWPQTETRLDFVR